MIDYIARLFGYSKNHLNDFDKFGNFRTDRAMVQIPEFIWNQIRFKLNTSHERLSTYMELLDQLSTISLKQYEGCEIDDSEFLDIISMVDDYLEDYRNEENRVY